MLAKQPVFQHLFLYYPRGVGFFKEIDVMKLCVDGK